jgi:hypothetical protein
MPISRGCALCRHGARRRHGAGKPGLIDRHRYNDLGLKRNYNTIAWSAVAGAERYASTRPMGRRLRLYRDDRPAELCRDDNIGPDLSDGPPQAQNPFPTSDDYPSTVDILPAAARLGADQQSPERGLFQPLGEYENMDDFRPLKASDALSFALVAGKVNAVNQLSR